MSSKNKLSKAPSAMLEKQKRARKIPQLPTVQRLFQTLCAQIDGGHWKRARKTCERILAQSPDDSTAHAALFFVLVRLEAYTDALELTPQVGFEKAYVLYRMGKEVEAVAVLDGDGKGTRGEAHLRAQISFRQGDYAECVEAYGGLEVTAFDEDEHTDILNNLSTAQAHLDFAARAVGAVEVDADWVPPPPASALTNIHTSLPQTMPSSSPTAKAKKPTTGTAPDPERWIKKTERSNYVPPKRRNPKGGASQGAAVDGGGGGGGGGVPGAGVGAGKKAGSKRK